MKCDSGNIIYLIPHECCGKQTVGSSTGFKERFRIYKSDISTGKVRCGVANHPLNVCLFSASKFEYLQVQLFEKVSVKNDDGIDKFLWEREKKYWQVQLFTLNRGLINPNERYDLNRRGYRKLYFLLIYYFP